MAIALLFVTAASPLLAQGAPSATPAPVTSPSPAASGTAGAAPVGHRQPRRGVVAETGPYDRSPEDIALDRKLKSICRGC